MSYSCSTCDDTFVTYQVPTSCGVCAANAERKVRMSNGSCGYGWSGWGNECPNPATQVAPDGFRLCDQHAVVSPAEATSTEEVSA